MGAKTPNITAAELRIMKVLWEIAPATVGDVRDAVTADGGDAPAYTTVMTLMNQLGAEGWDYVRADALPCEERVGFTGSKTTFQNVLVFRRVIESPQAQSLPARLMLTEAVATPPRLGPAEAPMPGNAPSVGPAKAGLAAE